MYYWPRNWGRLGVGPDIPIHSKEVTGVTVAWHLREPYLYI